MTSIFRNAIYSDSPAPSNQSLPALLDKALEQQGNYQPFYGYDDDRNDSWRRDQLKSDIAVLMNRFVRGQKPHQIRVLDVGSNAGYAAMVLSESIPHVIGVELDAGLVDLANTLAKRSGSRARFMANDAFELLKSGDAENIDAILILNVIHQVVHARGLDFAKSILAAVAAKVDFVLIELARREEYAHRDLGAMLPANPEEIFERCKDIDIELIRTEPRPLYILKRKFARFGDIVAEIDDISFSDSPDEISRKYYRLKDGKFLKLFRYTSLSSHDGFEREVAGLEAVDGRGVAPKLLGKFGNEAVGAVLMERVDGSTLKTLVQRGNIGGSLTSVIRDVIRCAAALAERGLYHNDLSLHNFVRSNDGSIKLVDFEQCGPQPLIDHFGFLLWSIHDLAALDLKSYNDGIYKKLVGAKQGERLAEYPDFSGVVLSPKLKPLVNAAKKATDWHSFVIEWANRI